MSAWHREHPELIGTEADPNMIHGDYRRLVPPPASDYERENWQELEQERQQLAEIDRPAEEDPIENDREWWHDEPGRWHR